MPLTLLFIVLVTANVLFSNQSLGRWDLTSEQRYTLSPTTTQVLQNLPAKITIKAFFTPDLPAPDHNLAGRIQDTLSEYNAASNGKVQFEVIYIENESDENIAKGFGLRKIAISQKDQNQVAMQMVYKGLAVLFENQAEVIPEIRSGDNFEYLLTKSLINLTRKTTKTIGILQEFGSIAENSIFLDSMRELFKEIYGNLITIEPVTITDECTLSQETDALVVLNLRQATTECARMALDQNLMHGKSLAIFQSPTASDFYQPDQPRMVIEHELYAMFEHYGVILNKDLLLDRNKNLVGEEITEDGSIPISLPALPIITRIHRESPMTQNLSAIIMPFSGTLELTPEIQNSPKVKITKLLESNPEAVTRQAGGNISWNALSQPRQDEKSGPHALAYAIEAPFSSYFADKTSENKSKVQNFMNSSEQSRLLVVSNGEFMFSQKTIGYTEQLARYGVHFFINTMDWLAQDEELVSIRNRNIPPLLTQVDENTQKRITYLNTFGIPFLVILLALGWHRIQEYRRKKLKHFVKNI